MPYLIGIGILVFLLIIFIGFRLMNSNRHLIPISVVAIIAGVFFESRRLSDKWQTVLLIGLASLIFSLLAFLPWKKEIIYNFDGHIEILPYYFIFFFIIFSMVTHKDKIIPKLTEGTTLLQSISVIYWVIDNGFIDTDSFLLKSVMFIGLLFSLYSLFHAFTHSTLTRTSRLTLSIWSSIIMLIFALDNIFRVYQNEDLEYTTEITDGLYIGLKYFLLGISSLYIVQNFFMLIGFLPGKGTFFNSKYFRELKELKNDHIKRYSDQQISIIYSFVCVLFTGTIFCLNYHFHIVPSNIAIWSMFVIFPIIIFLYEYATGKKNYS